MKARALAISLSLPLALLAISGGEARAATLLVGGLGVEGIGSGGAGGYGGGIPLVWSPATPSTPTVLGLGGAAQAWAWTTGAGHAVGNGTFGSGSRGLLWNLANPVSPIILGNLGNAGEALDIGASGLIVGDDTDPATNRQRAVVWTLANPTALPTILPDLGGSETYTWSISAGGIAGQGKELVSGRYRGLVWDPSNLAAAPVVLPDLGGDTYATEVGAGGVAGYGNDLLGAQHALYWSLANLAAGPTILQGFGGATYASGIDDVTGMIVGYAELGTGVVPVYWTSPGAAPIQLDGGTGYATGIYGGTIVGYSDQLGTVLWTLPVTEVPEPSFALVALVGIGALGLRRGR